MARKKKDTEDQAPADLAVIKTDLIEPARDQAAAKLAEIAALDMTVEQNRDYAASVGSKAASIWKMVNEKRQFMKAPSLEAGRRVDDFFNPALDTLDALVKAVKARMTEWSRAQEAEKARGLAAIEAGSRAPDVLAAAHTTTTMPVGFAPRKLLHVRIVDHDAIPRQFLQLDEMLVLGYARSRGGVECKIPGIEIYEEIDTVRTAGGAS